MNKITAKEGFYLTDKNRTSFYKELIGVNINKENYEEIEENEAKEIMLKNEKIQEINNLEKVDEIVYYNSIIPEAMNLIPMSNKEAIERTSLFPTWESFINKTLNKNTKIQYNNKLYEVIQTVNVVLEHQTPDLVPANYGLISEYDGTIDNPIPYEKMMIIKKDKYYTQYGILYIGLIDAPNGYDADLADLSTIVRQV